MPRARELSLSLIPPAAFSTPTLAVRAGSDVPVVTALVIHQLDRRDGHAACTTFSSAFFTWMSAVAAAWGM